MWDSPVYTGGDRIAILDYRIQIPTINYSVEESGIATSHNITADSTNVMFNTPYDVEVTAINTCENESDPARISICIKANSKYTVSCIYIIANANPCCIKSCG